MTDPVIPDPLKQKDLMSFQGPGRPPKQQTPGARPTMTPDQIIRQAAKNELPPGGNVDLLVKGVGALVQRKAVKLLQIGDTVFMLRPHPDGAVEFHTFTSEPIPALVQRFKAGVTSLKQMGFKKAFSTTNNPAFQKIAQQTGLPVRMTQTQSNIGGKMGPAFRFEVDL